MNKLSVRRKAAAKAQGVNTTGANFSAPVAVGQHAESSAMAESRGAIGGGFVSYDPVSAAAETNSDWQNEGRTELVSGSEETMHDASTNEEGASTASLPDLIYGAQEIDPVLAAFNNIPGSVPTSSNVLSIPPHEHQLPATLSPTPTETSDSFRFEENATPTYSYPSPPGAYHTDPYPTVLRGLPNAPHSSPAPSDQRGTNIDAFRSSPIPLQFPVDAPSSPQIPIDPALLQLDALVSNAVNPVQSIQRAEQTLRDMGVWPESPERSN
ncbi:hypothetical protein MMC22_002302 [Lobaria immixta]|nr:hypothetical protein [Lobaria immixta]